MQGLLPLSPNIFSSSNSLSSTFKKPTTAAKTKRLDPSDLDDFRLEGDKLVPIIEAIGKEVNNKENIVLEMKAKPYLFPLRSQEIEQDMPNWIPSMKGTLKVYHHKVNGKTRLVWRNVIGNVKVNLAIKGSYFSCLQKNVR